jgi:hypothetical protein
MFIFGLVSVSGWHYTAGIGTYPNTHPLEYLPHCIIPDWLAEIEFNP